MSAVVARKIVVRSATRARSMTSQVSESEACVTATYVGARHAVAFTHPGSPRVHDYGEDGQPCLVMEPAAGPLEAETGRRTLVTDRSGVCLPAGALTRLIVAEDAAVVP